MKLKKFCNGTRGKMFLPHAVSGLASFTYNDSKDKSFSPEKLSIMNKNALRLHGTAKNADMPV